MIASILAILTGLLDAINKTFPSYFPPKSTEQKVEEGAAAVDAKVSGEQNTGRPS